MTDEADIVEWRKAQYQTDEKLKKRIALHRRCSTNPQPWTAWVREQLPLGSGCRVLDLGCGSGDLWQDGMDQLPAPMDFVLADRSPGMLNAARGSLGMAVFRFLCCDAQHLPLKGDSFDLVLANHLLFLVPDIPAALAEIRRVLAPGGAVCATTYGWTNMQELLDLMVSVKKLFTGDPIFDPQNGPRRFALENGSVLLEQFFGNAEIRSYSAHLHVTEAQILMDYIQTVWQLTPAEEDALREKIEREIQRNAYYFISKSQGMLIAKK